MFVVFFARITTISSKKYQIYLVPHVYNNLDNLSKKNNVGIKLLKSMLRTEILEPVIVGNFNITNKKLKTFTENTFKNEVFTKDRIFKVVYEITDNNKDTINDVLTNFKNILYNDIKHLELE